MKKTFLIVAALFISVTASAQYYVSVNTGYSLGTGKKVLGSSISASGASDLEGSYGEGINTQIRGGYYFTDKFAVELGVGFLYGLDQEVRKISGVPNLPEADIEARGRAFGASLSGIYNITENVYVRAGLLTKLGGKTEANGIVGAALPVYNETGTVIAAPAPTSIEFTTDFKGEFPLGFVGAAGYKFPITEKWSLFAELEYMNINVTRDKSLLQEFNAVRADGRVVTRNELLTTIAVLTSPASTLPATTQQSLTELSYLFRDEFVWGTEGTIKPDAPYSSFGINFGVIYNF